MNYKVTSFLDGERVPAEAQDQRTKVYRSRVEAVKRVSILVDAMLGDGLEIGYGRPNEAEAVGHSDHGTDLGMAVARQLVEQAEEMDLEGSGLYHELTGGIDITCE